MRLKLIIGLWISLVILASCEERADYLNWSRKVANYCKYVKFSEESKRYECGPKLGEFYTYIIVHPDYDLPKNPIYPLVAYDKQDNVVMVGGNGKGQIWRMIKFEIWAFVRETKTGMKEVYYDEDEKAFIGLEIGDNKEDIKSKAWWSKDGGKSWVRARVPLFKKKSNSVVPVSPLVGGPVAPRTRVLKPLAKAPAGPKLPVGGIAEAVGGGYAVAIGKVGGKATVWSSKATVPRDWKVISGTEIKNPHTGSLPGSLQKTSLVDLKKVSFAGSDFRIEDEDGDLWISKNNGQSWEMEKFGGGSGTVGDPYGIASAAHLWLVRTELDKHFKLTKDLDLRVITEPAGFDPIGDDVTKSDVTKSFRGTFNGKGRVIRNLRIDRPSESATGLFTVIVSGGMVKNIGLKDADVKGGSFTGGLVGINRGGTIENIYVTGKVTGGSEFVNHIGGLMGINLSGTIKNSYATGKVTVGEGQVGGLVGSNWAGRIENSYAKGDVEGGKEVGGLIGSNISGNIINNYATGNVSGNNEVGGLIGNISNDTRIQNNYATGNVTGTTRVGGLVGCSCTNNGRIVESHATGKVEGEYTSGGLVGINGGTIEKSYATGAVEGKEKLGGLVGVNDFKGKIEKSYATGAVEGEKYLGGLVGMNHRAVIANSYATGKVTGTKGYVGGLVGHHTGGTIEKNYATGAVKGSGSNRVGGFIGNNNHRDTKIIGNNYWKAQTSSVAKGVGEGSGANVERNTDAELKGLDAGKTGWSTDTWNFEAGQYPKLEWQD